MAQLTCQKLCVGYDTMGDLFCKTLILRSLRATTSASWEKTALARAPFGTARRNAQEEGEH